MPNLKESERKDHELASSSPPPSPPVKITHGEDGHPLPETSHIALRHIPVEEDDEELIVNAEGE
jgi:hypothetical protein